MFVLGGGVEAPTSGDPRGGLLVVPALVPSPVVMLVPDVELVVEFGLLPPASGDIAVPLFPYLFSATLLKFATGACIVKLT